MKSKSTVDHPAKVNLNKALKSAMKRKGEEKAVLCMMELAAKGRLHMSEIGKYPETMADILKRAEANCAQIARDPITDLLNGIRFHRKEDRGTLHAGISKMVAQAVAGARIEADVRNDENAKRLHAVIDGLRYELQRAHRVWAEQIIEARGANNHIETIGRAYRPDAGEECR